MRVTCPMCRRGLNQRLGKLPNHQDDSGRAECPASGISIVAAQDMYANVMAEAELPL